MSTVKRTILLSIFVSLSFITVLAQQPQVHLESGAWVSVVPENAGFTILMPAKPGEKVEPMEGHPGVDNHTLTVETRLAGYVVSYIQFPDNITDPALIKEMLDRGRDGGVAASGGEINSEKEIKINGNYGREWTMKLPGGFSATARAYWVKRRLYQTVFVVAPSASDPPEVTKLRQEAATKFLDSFTLSGDSTN